MVGGLAADLAIATSGLGDLWLWACGGGGGGSGIAAHRVRVRVRVREREGGRGRGGVGVGGGVCGLGREKDMRYARLVTAMLTIVCDRCTRLFPCWNHSINQSPPFFWRGRWAACC